MREGAYDGLDNKRNQTNGGGRLVAEDTGALSLREPGNWFADEVAIDFPAIGAVIDRMRDAFLAHELSRPVSAEILLSARQAFDGAVVPLEVPVRRLCSSCGGRGEEWDEPCGACKGTGDTVAHYPVRLVVPRRVMDGARLFLRVSAPSVAPTRVEVRVAIR